MNSQLSLITQNSTWMHYIGTGYYADEKKFLREAKKFGISRRAPAQTVRGMEFGDRLIFLRYIRERNIYAFAEAQITGISLDYSISKQVGERLIEQGRGEYQQGGMDVERECGSYTVIGTFIVRASLKEVMTLAQEIHERENGDVPLFVMVNAKLTHAYKEQVILSPAPKFTRGFIRSEFSYLPSKQQVKGEVIAIAQYTKKERPRRKAATTPLLPEPA